MKQVEIPGIPPQPAIKFRKDGTLNYTNLEIHNLKMPPNSEKKWEKVCLNSRTTVSLFYITMSANLGNWFCSNRSVIFKRSILFLLGRFLNLLSPSVVISFLLAK